MGCTSSAPNMTDFQTNATEGTNTEINNGANEGRNAQDNKSTQISDDNRVNSDGQMCTEMLPTCDNLTENIQLLSHNSSYIFSNSPTENSAKDMKEIPLEMRDQDNSAEKLTTFIDVADKVIVNNILEDETVEEEPEGKVDTVSETETKNETSTNEEQKELDADETVRKPDVIISVDFDEKEEVENNQEHESPTQSECSRSTRWEALADIAAELPPTLAVDPVTGQIYSLSK